MSVSHFMRALLTSVAMTSDAQINDAVLSVQTGTSPPPVMYMGGRIQRMTVMSQQKRRRIKRGHHIYRH